MNTTIDLTPIVNAVIILASALITTFLIPLIAAKTSSEKQQAYLKTLDTLVGAAEQMFKSGGGSLKLEQVQKWLEEKGYKVDFQDIQNAVLRLHADGLSYNDAHARAVGGEDGKEDTGSANGEPSTDGQEQV